MFENIGSKVKGLARVCFILLCVSACISGIYLMTHSMVLAGIISLVAGCLLAWVSCWVTYAIGAAASYDEDFASMQRELQALENKLDKLLAYTKPEATISESIMAEVSKPAQTKMGQAVEHQPALTDLEKILTKAAAFTTGQGFLSFMRYQQGEAAKAGNTKVAAAIAQILANPNPMGVVRSMLDKS